jgi:hypothetical protein
MVDFLAICYISDRSGPSLALLTQLRADHTHAIRAPINEHLIEWIHVWSRLPVHCHRLLPHGTHAGVGDVLDV